MLYTPQVTGFKQRMPLLVWIIVFTLMGGVLSVLAASVFLCLPEGNRAKILPHGVSFATGALLSASFAVLLPHAFEQADSMRVHDLSVTLLVGILTFFLLEKLFLWRHSHNGRDQAHGHHEESGRQPSGSLILLGDAIHNFVDGVLIGAAFLTDTQLGIVTSLAVATHEIPQEVGDFAILLESGYARTSALLWNILASITTVFGGIMAYFGLSELDEVLPFLLVFAASSFIYVAVADLIPSLNRKTDFQSSLYQVLLIGAGVLMIFGSHKFVH